MKRFIFYLMSVLIILFLLAMLLPAHPTSGKLYGNKYALNNCKWRTILWKRETTNSPNFDFWKLSFDDKRAAIILGLYLETSFKTNFVWQSDKTKREIVIVCGEEFDNVPKSPWTFFLKNPAHAVGYSDGTTGLISPEQFANFNFSGFVSASSLATNSELNVFGK